MRFSYPRQQKEPHLCIADFYRPAESGEPDFAAFHIVTMGERIVAHGLEPGDRLPSEPELARSLGVSRSSLREGIALLEEDGVVRRLHGSGTYVSHRPGVRNDLSRNFSVSSLTAAPIVTMWNAA
jgi:DNA-binding FadR family transcriptional regulator